MGLNDGEYTLLCELVGRTPSLTELGMYAVMWSEHCGYKYSRPVLAYFKRYKAALEGEGFENAGIVPLDDRWGVTMKVESHNHPSAVEPFQGAATGVGGILRDIFTMGARPIASLNSLRFGPIRDGEAAPAVVARNRYLVEHVVEGIASYGNCVGVPTVGGEVAFHPRYSGNPLVNAMAVGLVELDQVATAEAQGIGSPVLYLGSATGKDGIHGATFASDALGEDNDAKRPNVQIGDPFAEKLLIEATLEALKTGAVQSIQDMGAAGLTCSTVEMSSKGGVGMDVNLDLVPMRESDMTAYELMLSESQERMLAVAYPGREQEVIDVFHKWGVPAVVIGHVTDTGRVRASRFGQVEADIVAKDLTDRCPTYTTPIEEPAYHRAARDFDLDRVPLMDPIVSLPKLLAAPNIASKRWVYQQYDQQVQTQTILGPGAGDAAVIAPRGAKAAFAVKIDGNGRHVYFDPYEGGMGAVAESARNVAVTGARPRAVTDGLNFGNPERPHVYWQFERAVKGIADAAEALGTPVVSGNVSFYNQSDLGEVFPTPLIGMLGILDDAAYALGCQLPEDEAATLVYIAPSPARLPQQGLGASEALAELAGIEDGLPTPVNLKHEAALHVWLPKMAAQGKVRAAHDVSDGGPATALAEMALGRRVHVAADLEPLRLTGQDRDDAVLFAEVPGGVWLAVDSSAVDDVIASAQLAGLTALRAGGSVPAIEAGRLSIGAYEWSLTELTNAYEMALPNLLESCGHGEASS